MLSFFDISSETLTGSTNEVIGTVVSRLNKVLGDKNLRKSLVKGLEVSENEKEQFVYVSSVLHNLTGTFSFSAKEYNTKLFSKLKIEYVPDLAPMGMGEANTWRGAPDGYCDVVVTNTTEDEDDSDSDVSSGGKATCEAKRVNLGLGDLNQVTGHSVVMSFVHFNRHPDQNSLVPAIGICGKFREFVASLYDCHRDVLLYLHPVQWLNSSGSFDESAIVLLWLLLHHKLFLCRLSDATECYKSGLQEISRQAGVLQNYQSQLS